MGSVEAQKRHSSKPPATVFLAATIVVFFTTLSAADSIGIVPDYIDGTTPAPAAAPASEQVPLSSLPELGFATSTQPVVGVEPTRIAIPAISLDLAVQNPSTTDVQELDSLLQNGPARYAPSAELGAKGTMIIFAHSSHLPIVHNKMFQAFNNIPELKAGDLITLTGKDGKNYMYSVNDVAKADINDGTSISLAPSEGTRLVLVTCDTLTGKSARYVLTADFVGVVGK